MKQTLNSYQVAEMLFQDRESNGFSYQGCKALAEWIDELDEDCGADTEIDVVALRCDFSEAESAEEYLRDYMTPDQFDDEFAESEDIETDCREYLDENTLAIEFEGGLIVQAF